MPNGRVIFGKPKPKQKPKRKTLRIYTGPLFAGIKIKDECYSVRLPDEYQAPAAKAYCEGMLDLLDGTLRCECGASVGARKSNMGNFFAPTRHSVYKALPQPARKRGPHK